MDLLELVKKRKTIRRYKEKVIPQKILDKIIEAGIWGPSVPSFLQIQPWKFIVIKDKEKIESLAGILKKKSRKASAGVNVMLSSAASIIGGAAAVILIYNSKDLDEKAARYKVIYSKFRRIIKTAQLCAISATIQNMILVAEYLGIGSCWLDTPLFCKNEINKFLGVEETLAGVLTLGYPAEEGKRSPRKSFNEMVKYI